MAWLKSLVRKWHTLQRLSREERRLLRQALVLFPLVTISLHLCGMKRTQSFLSRLIRNSRAFPPASTEPQLWKTVRMVRIAHRYNASWASCLRHSLVLWCLLRRQKIEADLRIGVGREEGAFAAHAWVEHQGMVLNDGEDVHERFAAFDSPVGMEVR